MSTNTGNHPITIPTSNRDVLINLYNDSLQAEDASLAYAEVCCLTESLKKQNLSEVTVAQREALYGKISETLQKTPPMKFGAASEMCKFSRLLLGKGLSLLKVIAENALIASDPYTGNEPQTDSDFIEVKDLLRKVQNLKGTSFKDVDKEKKRKEDLNSYFKKLENIFAKVFEKTHSQSFILDPNTSPAEKNLLGKCLRLVKGLDEPQKQTAEENLVNSNQN